jgi:hypothetical protein
LRRPAHYYFFIIFYPRKTHFFILEPPANYFLFFIFIDPAIIPIPHFYFHRACRRSARCPAHYFFSLLFLPGKHYFFILELSAHYFSLSFFDPHFLIRRSSPAHIFISTEPSGESSGGLRVMFFSLFFHYFLSREGTFFVPGAFRRLFFFSSYRSFIVGTGLFWGYFSVFRPFLRRSPPGPGLGQDPREHKGAIYPRKPQKRRV